MNHGSNYPTWFDDSIQRFRKAWEDYLAGRRPRPDIGEFLQGSTIDLRARLAVALIEDEFFYRYDKLHEKPRVEEHLSRWPELGKSRSSFARLLRCELDYRVASGESSNGVRAEMCGRFPNDRDFVAGICSKDERPNPFPDAYDVLARLGSGGFCEVWLAEDLKLGKYVALKQVKAGDGHIQALATLRNEARLLAALEHPNIVRVDVWLEAGDMPYLVLKYVAGGSLETRVNREGPLSWDMAARCVADVAEGLLAAHARGIIHRDVKPANILWDDEKQEAVLTDLGVSARLGRVQGGAGTLGFVAPEALEGAVTPYIDVFSLAATLFWLVTGQLPFTIEAQQQYADLVKKGLPDPDPRCAGMPAAIEELIRAGLAAKPEQRLTLQEFTTGLRGWLNRLLADTLIQPLVSDEQPHPTVDLRLLVSKQMEDGSYSPLATTHPHREEFVRDLKRVPHQPNRATLRTGDRVRVEVVAGRPGFVTVFNVGPAGNLNLLYPEQCDSETHPAIEPHRPLEVAGVQVTPPEGNERIFAVWTRTAWPLGIDELRKVAEGGDSLSSGPYRATRDMKRLHESLAGLRPEDWHAVVLELNHQ